MQDKNVEDRRYLLQIDNGEYVKDVESTGMETVKTHFKFCLDEEKAKVFSYNDLFNRQDTSPIGIEFARGFSGGKLVRII